jgi:hypothetical protein
VARLFAYVLMLYNNLDVQVQIADNKAHLVMAANTILLTGLALNREGLQTAFQDFGDPLSLLALGATLLMLLMIFGSLYFALMVARPRLIGISKATDTPRNLFFFGDVQSLGRDDFVEQFMHQDMTTIKRQVLQQIHNRSRVVMRKYEDSRRSINYLVGAIVFWVLAQMLMAAA